MRAQTSTLTNASKADVRTPITSLQIDDRYIGMHRPRWALLHNDPAIPQAHAVSGGAYDGALLRARLHPTNGILYTQRVTDGSSAAQWASWTASASSCNHRAGLALAWDGNTIQALFHTGPAGKYLYCRDSSTNGASYGAAATVHIAANQITGIAASLNAGYEELYVAWAEEDANGTTTVKIASRPEAGGSWSAPVQGLSFVGPCYGLAIDGRGSVLNVVISMNHSLTFYQIDPAALGVWGDPDTVLPTDTALVSYRYPSIGIGIGSHYLVFHVEHTDDYDRLQHTFTHDWSHVSRFPRPYDFLADYGACAASDATHHYLMTSRSVYRAPRWDADDETMLLTITDPRELLIEEHATRPGRLVATFTTNRADYLTARTTGQPILLGSQVAARLGYRTSAGEELQRYRPYWITAIRQTHSARMKAWNAHTITLQATDGWGILARTKSRRTHTWLNRTILQILTDILAGQGFAVTNDADAAWSRTLTAFITPAGATLDEPVKRLLELADGHLTFRSDPDWYNTWPSAVAHLRRIAASADTSIDASSWPIERADDTTQDQDATHIIATAPTGQSEAIDQDTVDLTNTNRPTIASAANLSAAHRAQWATQAAEAAKRGQKHTTLNMVPNLALETGDHIALTHSTLALAAVARVLADIKTELSTPERRFIQTLDLEQANP